eukprot:6040229-Prymnesium_polylepis.1
MFPNPICGPGCDFGVECERRGHYVGFRTVAESRAIREGRGEHYDLKPRTVQGWGDRSVGWGCE